MSVQTGQYWGMPQAQTWGAQGWGNNANAQWGNTAASTTYPSAAQYQYGATQGAAYNPMTGTYQAAAYDPNAAWQSYYQQQQGYYPQQQSYYPQQQQQNYYPQTQMDTFGPAPGPTGMEQAAPSQAEQDQALADFMKQLSAASAEPAPAANQKSQKKQSFLSKFGLPALGLALAAGLGWLMGSKGKNKTPDTQPVYNDPVSGQAYWQFTLNSEKDLEEGKKTHYVALPNTGVLYTLEEMKAQEVPAGGEHTHETAEANQAGGEQTQGAADANKAEEGTASAEQQKPVKEDPAAAGENKK